MGWREQGDVFTCRSNTVAKEEKVILNRLPKPSDQTGKGLCEAAGEDAFGWCTLLIGHSSTRTLWYFIQRYGGMACWGRCVF